MLYQGFVTVSSPGGNHISGSSTAEPTAPIAIIGRRRPQRVRGLSEMFPISGSVIASTKRGIDSASPASPAGMLKAVT